MLVAALAGGGAAWEALRIVHSRPTVHSGWAAGAGWGAGAAVGVPVVLFLVVKLPRRTGTGKAGSRWWLIPVGILAELVPFSYAMTVSFGGRHYPHYVTTSGVGIAGMAFVGATLAIAMLCVLWAFLPGKDKEQAPAPGMSASSADVGEHYSPRV